MGYKAAVQVLKNAEDLKLKVSRKCDLLNDTDAWTYQQQLQTLYHQVLVLDLEYALDKKVEQELWTFGFKNHITSLQELTRDKKNPNRSDYQALLSWCLEAASGFYLTLLQELCTSFGLDLPFRRCGAVYGQMKENSNERDGMPQSSSCLYICQYCLVHLGDIARYRNQRKQAESFYRQAIFVSPCSGHPYNQLALLEASQGNKLSSVFHYVRGISVKHPFPAAITNLTNTLSAAAEKESPIKKVNTKITAAEFIQLFLCVHGLLHTATDLDQAELGAKSMNATLTALVATQSFTKEKLIEMTIINLYALAHLDSKGDEKLNELTDDEIKVKDLILDLLAGAVSAFLIPVHTLKTDHTLLEYYALPAVKFLSWWIQSDPDVLREKVFLSRLQIWPSLCKLLNSIQPFLRDFNYQPFEHVPLSEDIELQGFLPLAKSLDNLDFKEDQIEDAKTEHLVRAHRLVSFGKWLSDDNSCSTRVINFKRSDTDENIITFEPACIQPDPTENLLEEMKSFNFAEAQLHKSLSPEKRGGILKPQGSLEKSREEREQILLSEGDTVTEIGNDNLNSGVTTYNKSESGKLRRVWQNVALQSIFKKMEENKQVKFCVAPTEEQEEKSVKFDPKPPSKSNAPSTSSTNNQHFKAQPVSHPYPNVPIELPKDVVTTGHVNQSKISFDKNMSLLYQRADMLQANQCKNLPFPLSSNQMLPQYNTAQTLNQPRPYQQTSQNPAGIQPPFQNMQYPPYSAWKQEDRPTASNPWWHNCHPQENNYQMNVQFPNNLPYVQNTSSFGNMEFGNKPSNMEMYSPWNNQRTQAVTGYETANQNLRQLMLKEATNMPAMGYNQGTSRMNTVPQDKNMHVSNTAAYSLFNTNSWNPNLPAQLKNSRSVHDNLGSTAAPNNSLFSGQGPQSLAQLLEQQSQWQKNDL